MTAILETAPGIVEWPLHPDGGLSDLAVRCVCLCECPPAPPPPAAIGVFALGIAGASLAAFAAGRLARIRRKVRL